MVIQTGRVLPAALEAQRGGKGRLRSDQNLNSERETKLQIGSRESFLSGHLYCPRTVVASAGESGGKQLMLREGVQVLPLVP